MKTLAATLILFTVCVGTAGATPDPTYCTVMPQDQMAVPRIVGIPDQLLPPPAAWIDIYIRNAENDPVPDCFVTLDTSCEDPPLCFCGFRQVTHGYTDANGHVRFMVTLGGCCQQSQAAWIDACGVIIRVYNAIVSPDFDGLEGDCVVGLADFIVFGQTWAHWCPTR